MALPKYWFDTVFYSQNTIFRRIGKSDPLKCAISGYWLTKICSQWKDWHINCTGNINVRYSTGSFILTALLYLYMTSVFSSTKCVRRFLWSEPPCSWRHDVGTGKQTCMVRSTSRWLAANSDFFQAITRGNAYCLILDYCKTSSRLCTWETRKPSCRWQTRATLSGGL